MTHKRLRPELLDRLVCPLGKGRLQYDFDRNELVSVAMRLAYPIKDTVPRLSESDARDLTDSEYERWSR